jgi:hypothetical protein
MEKLICPQCGGNEFKVFGNSAYKCESCGTILKEEEEGKALEKTKYEPLPAPSPFTTSVEKYGTDFSNDIDNDNNSTSGNNNDNDDGSSPATKQIVGILFAVVIVVVIISVVLFEKNNFVQKFTITPVINQIASLDSIAQSTSNIFNTIPDLNAKISYDENGITVKDVELSGDDETGLSREVKMNDKLQVSLLKPKGFTKAGNKVYIGMSFVVKNHDGKILYTSDDINKTAGEQGEDYHHYQKNCSIGFITSDAFGFKTTGNYTVEFRVWDKKSKKEITGVMPLFVQE